MCFGNHNALAINDNPLSLLSYFSFIYRHGNKNILLTIPEHLGFILSFLGGSCCSMFSFPMYCFVDLVFFSAFFPLRFFRLTRLLYVMSPASFCTACCVNNKHELYKSVF